MPKEIELPKIDLVDRLRKMLDHFQESNNCRLLIMVAYPEYKKSEVIGAEPKPVIQARLFGDMPDDILPVFVPLFLSECEKAKERVMQNQEKKES